MGWLNRRLLRVACLCPPRYPSSAAACARSAVQSDDLSRQLVEARARVVDAEHVSKQLHKVVTERDSLQEQLNALKYSQVHGEKHTCSGNVACMHGRRRARAHLHCLPVLVLPSTCACALPHLPACMWFDYDVCTNWITAPPVICSRTVVTCVCAHPHHPWLAASHRRPPQPTTRCAC